MNSKSLTFLLLVLFAPCISTIFAQSTAFTYQGRLTDNGTPATGVYDLRFHLASDPLGATAVGGILTSNSVPLSNGLFTVTLDFGAAPFTGADLWLQVDVRTNAGASYTPLNPLQRLTSAPYAIQAATAALAANSLKADSANSVSASNIVGLILLTQLPESVLTNNQSGPITLGGTLSLPNPATIYSGTSSLLRSDPTNRNFFAGNSAGSAISIGIQNTANGHSAMKNTTTGSSNTANGSYSLFFNTTGSNNTAGGSYALFSNLTGGDNTADGYYAMGYNKSGNFNTALGNTALLYNNDGSYNTALGACALYYVTNGGFNTAIGESALANMQSGTANIGIGYYAGAHLTNGRDNIYIGNSHNGASGNPNETNVMRLGTTQTQTFIAGVINGNGSGLTNVTSTVTNLPPGVLTNNSSGVALTGTFIGGGAGLTNLFAENLNGALSDARLSGNVALRNANQAFVGSNSFSDVSINAGAALYFGATTRQMLNLWESRYGIGVQSYTTYFRTDTDGGFAWFEGGVHNDSPNNPGGGLVLMRLDSRGNLFTSGSISPTSDRNMKENFTAVTPREVLEKVAQLPITTWNYKQDATTRHLGPVAQDFYAAFGVGSDDKHIATVDADGVALAAIQGLNQKLAAELKLRDAENAALKKRLEKIEQLLEQRSDEGQ